MFIFEIFLSWNSNIFVFIYICFNYDILQVWNNQRPFKCYQILNNVLVSFIKLCRIKKHSTPYILIVADAKFSVRSILCYTITTAPSTQKYIDGWMLL